MVPAATQEHIMNFGYKPIYLTLALLATTFVNHADAVEPPGAVPQAVVNYSDLNLDSPAGAATLYLRIAHAADRVCPSSGRETLLAEANRRSCTAHAIRRAVETVNARELTRYYAMKTGQSVNASERVASGK
jgi:UrcA family protein